MRVRERFRHPTSLKVSTSLAPVLCGAIQTIHEAFTTIASPWTHEPVTFCSVV
ncbi:conserved hypothetical protein [Mycobacterium tuberculosis T17]|nr:conserved hypothetical protein [Mycobacterium tuberculosis T17]